jgi:uncharacterized protein (TIGR03790 family)
MAAVTLPTFLRRFLPAVVVVISLSAAACALALQPDEIALIVNSNEPAGRDLARFYAQARHIPDNRILELDLPKSEEMPLKDYERTVVPQVREFLRTGHLEQQVQCFVTFYGVPLRLADRVNTAAENREQADLRQELLKTAAQAIAPVKALEQLAERINPAFQPGIGNDLDHLALRAREAERDIITRSQAKSDPAERAQLVEELFATLEPLAGDAMKIKQMALHQLLHPTTQPAEKTALLAAKSDFDRAVQTVTTLEQSPFDAAARQKLRQLASKQFGLFGYVKLLREQVEYLDTADTSSAFDSELSLVRWVVYPHARWRDNPLFYAARKPPVPLPPACMVMRLDAPKPETVKQIITASIQAETHGLQGKVVLDSRGMIPGHEKPSERGLAEYDQMLRDLGDLLRAHTKLDVVVDDKPEVLPPHSVNDVALYCGWYSLRHYVPSCQFVPGAVGYHIASFELVSLHGANETGWVAGLLNNGVAATFGPVAEPYVQAFPRPDDFFPLLLTGKMTLAEVYWHTTPMASWRMSAIGDPLYTPYKVNPALAVKDLPVRLQALFNKPATQSENGEREH